MSGDGTAVDPIYAAFYPDVAVGTIKTSYGVAVFDGTESHGAVYFATGAVFGVFPTANVSIYNSKVDARTSGSFPGVQFGVLNGTPSISLGPGGSGGAFDVTVTRTGAGAATVVGTLTIPAPVITGVPIIQDSADATKQLAFNASGIATGTTRTLAAPNASGTLALTADVATETTRATSAEASIALGVYGDGSDGTVNFDGTTTVLGLVPAGGAYSMLRDLYLADGSQISSTAILNPKGWRIYCQGTFTIGASAKLVQNGNAAVGKTGGVGYPSQTVALSGGGVGGTGAAGANGTAPAAVTSSLTTVTAAKGGGTSAGTGNGATAANTASLAVVHGSPKNLGQAMSMKSNASSSATSFAGGIGGNAGDGLSTGIGGGGGGAGGIIWMAVQNLVNNGQINVIGGAGGAGTVAVAGGGGGGSGGAIVLIYHTITLGTTNVSGGAGGAAFSTGGTGANGPSGTVWQLAT